MRDVAGHGKGRRGVAGCLSEEVGKLKGTLMFPKVEMKFGILKGYRFERCS